MRVDLRDIIDDLNAKYGGRPIEDEAQLSLAIKHECESRGVRVDEVVWSDGDYGRKCDIRISPELGEIMVEIVRP